MQLKHILSREATGFWQFAKYAVIGALATVVQTAIFYLLACTLLKCLSADDWAVRFLGFPAAGFTGSEPWYLTRGMLAAEATAIGFGVANVVCWWLNRALVFPRGRYVWYVELVMFFSTSALATVLALGIMKLAIDRFGMMTSLAVVVEVFASLIINFIVRKFVIFRVRA